MSSIAFFTVGYGALFLLFTSGQSIPILSNEDAAKIIQRDASTMSVLADSIGNLSVIRQDALKPKPNYGKGEITTSDFAEIQILAKLGVVNISRPQDLSRQFTNWNDWFATTQQGVATRLTVSATRDINKYTQCSEGQRTWVAKTFAYGEQSFVCFPVGELSIERIVSNEARVVAADHYAIVMGTYALELTPLMRSFFSLAGQQPTNKKKFMAALKFDPFEGSWVIRALDQADREQEFKTQNVNALLTNGNH